eukprot:CAMPEP_0117734766 /NCGR_PEP_ID=MMETSP0947-20121206/883_1 /TAXON_ID=44440 /ORGANISM="Chattonella subsalsa, Strain CCMP2191" /LENGTH=521 /DNA_ID=CAMNT_0005549635 /DNA_START=26 /DNA_END=1591 /DNA_ORIENTATION=-
MISSPSSKSKALASISYVRDLDAGNSLEHYKILDEVGSGQYGKVFKATSRKTGKLYALKAIDFEALDDPEKQNILSQVKVWKRVYHPAVVHHIDHFVGRGQLWVVMEHCRSDLFSFVRCRRVARRPLNEKLVWRILHSICEGLSFLHSQGLAHGAVKASNILMAKEGRFKLGNFGFKRTKLSSWENTADSHSEFQSDMWSLGYVLYLVCQMEPLFDSSVLLEGSTGVKKAHLCKPLPLPSFYSRLLKALVFRLLSGDPEQRPSADEVLAMVPGRLSKEFYSQQRGRRHCCHHSQSTRTSKLTVVQRKSDFVSHGGLMFSSVSLSTLGVHRPHFKYSRIANTHSMHSAREMTLGRRQGPVADPGGPGRPVPLPEIHQLTLAHDPLDVNPSANTTVTQTMEPESDQEKDLLISPISVNRSSRNLLDPLFSSHNTHAKTWNTNPTEPLPLKHRQSAKTWNPDLASPDETDIDQGNNARPKNNRWSSSLRRSASEELQSAQLQRDTQRPKTSKDRSLNFYSAWSM